MTIIEVGLRRIQKLASIHVKGPFSIESRMDRQSLENIHNIYTLTDSCEETNKRMFTTSHYHASKLRFLLPKSYCCCDTNTIKLTI
jgi:hypothetical protein